MGVLRNSPTAQPECLNELNSDIAESSKHTNEIIGLSQLSIIMEDTSDETIINLKIQSEIRDAVKSIKVIAHPAPASASPGRLADITNRTVSSTEARLAFAVLTTERKAA